MQSCRVSLSKVDRKTIERNRRMQMKGLCFKLATLIPRHYNSTKEISSQQDRLDHAASYIKELQQRVEELKRRKQYLAMNINGTNNDIRDKMTINGSNLPVIELRDFGHSLEVTLMSGFNSNFMFYEVINVLAEEGAEIINASFSVVGDKIFHTFHSQAASSRVGVETSSLCQRLKELVY
ncbi:transcription factor bHLH162-like [Macadamia integrifolia]|uniref:transcription factor bHLH162-like n=1 Tax=Macadamia integrifolia TaxID=60698 RepID=UPI001C4F8791|nr:transcription factor bHLH162-like [Macadamia integrifolia]